MKRTEIRLLRYPELLLPDVLKRIGYSSPKELDDTTRARVLSLIDEARSLLKVDWTVRHAPILGWSGEMIEGEGIAIFSRKWAQLLAGMDSPELVCAFAVTLGARLDMEIATHQVKSVFETRVLDAFGSTAAEQAADSVSDMLSRKLRDDGYVCTQRFSPGHCDWALEEGQKALFAFLLPETIGIRRLVSGAIIPVKSITAVVIAARRVPVKTPCHSCYKAECTYRMEKFDPEV